LAHDLPKVIRGYTVCLPYFNLTVKMLDVDSFNPLPTKVFHDNNWRVIYLKN
jgi:hypothetical protein